jgi:multicomponent Na+:H+ antiporter subunit G
VIDVAVGVLLLLGAAFVLISAIGVLRFPDVFMRMHAATKAGTLGGALILLAAVVAFGSLGVTVKVALVFLFILLTAPVAAHLLGRAAFRSDVTLWERTRVDELPGRDPAAASDGAPPAAHRRGDST